MRGHDPYIGTDIAGQFRILDRIGSGGMGAVYKAEQPSMNRFVAVKILHSRYVSRPDLVARFRREARAMSHLSHPSTARVYLYGQLDDGACYIVMEHLEGMNLAQMVRAQGPFEPARALNMMMQVCGALEEAHRAGIVHRDLKPENVFVTSAGGIPDFPKVLDFGLAKVTEREMRPGSLILTQEGMVFGTPEFMSPEQSQGKTLDGRSDIYSLGVILFEMLTGKLPFDAKAPMDYIQHHIHSVPATLRARAPEREFPLGLEELVARVLSKHPDGRPQTAAELAAEMRDVIQARVHSGALRAVPALRLAHLQQSQQQPPAAQAQYGALPPQVGKSGPTSPTRSPRAPNAGSASPDRHDAYSLPMSKLPILFAVGVLVLGLLSATVVGIALLLK